MSFKQQNLVHVYKLEGQTHKENIERRWNYSRILAIKEVDMEKMKLEMLLPEIKEVQYPV